MSVLRLDRTLNLVFWLLVAVLGYAVGRRFGDFDWRSFWAVVSISGVGYALGVSTWRCWQLRGVANDVNALETAPIPRASMWRGSRLPRS